MVVDPNLVKRITEEVLARLHDKNTLRVPVGVSVRHVHLSAADLATLFGLNYELQPLRELQPGEFAAKETVTLVGKNLRTLENVRILGPVRFQTQVELSRTDAIYLGLDPPWRASGQLQGSESICLVGPCGSVYLPEGVILARRHIHMPEHVARQWGIKDNEEVSVIAETERPLIFQGVQVRVGSRYRLEIHLDTDDANAAGLKNGSTVRVLLGGEANWMNWRKESA
ncbi:phosphate propanoyltransferase [Neomoorella humiferrea]|uniref:phosphate propanoyltransferase n=1 Tax=Neomoorella humiferrea TaxID=676965 RepID=UPI003D8BF56F